MNGNWTYSYDSFNRLVGANQNNGQSVYSYVYDRFGNRWQQNGPHTMMLTFSSANNRMDGYSYDAAGNVLNDGSHSYTYDAENRIVKVDGGTTATHGYDGEGNRAEKTSTVGSDSEPAGSWDFLYDLSGRMVTQLSDPNETSWRGEAYAGSRHLAAFYNGDTIFPHSDWLGTDRKRMDYVYPSSPETCTSLPFGDWLTCSGTDASPLHFTGKERDAESGLDNFGARYDSSSMGRFMSADPKHVSAHLSDPQSFNRYAYTRNNPLLYVDPDGKDFEKAWSDIKTFASSVYWRLSGGGGLQGEIKAGPLKLHAGVSSKWSAEVKPFANDNRVVTIIKTVESGATAEFGKFSAGRGVAVEQQVGALSVEPNGAPSIDTKKGIPEAYMTGSAGSEAGKNAEIAGVAEGDERGIGLEVGALLLAGTEIGSTNEGLAAWSDAVKEIKDSLTDPGPPAPPQPPTAAPCAINLDTKCKVQ